MSQKYVLYVGRWHCVKIGCKFHAEENIAVPWPDRKDPMFESDGATAAGSSSVAAVHLTRMIQDNFEGDDSYVAMAVQEHEVRGHNSCFTLVRVGVVRRYA